MKVKEAEIVIIGAGPGGYTAAFYAADMGMKTAIIERYPTLGGVCLNVGCIPSKALLHMAAVKEDAQKASDFGLELDIKNFDLAKMRNYKENVVGKLTGGLSQLAKARSVAVYSGIASFSDTNNLIVTDENNQQTRIVFQKAIIATGSSPIKPPVFDFTNDRIMTSTSALALKDIPEKLLVVGGGVIGLELGSFYANFGSEVTVVEAQDKLVVDVDRDIFRILRKKLKKSFTDIKLNTMVESLTSTKTSVKAKLKSGDKVEDATFSRALVCIGRHPNSKDLKLENAGISVDSRGFIGVDKQMRTTAKNIFAIGDVIGNPMLAHKASREAHIAVDAAMDKKTQFENICIPNVIYTEPEVAWVGLTEKEAAEKNIAYEAATFPWGASGRALAMGKTEGMTKILFDPKTERVLGVSIAGVNAGELIAEGTLAVEMGAVMEDIAGTIHAHPTLSETIMEASEDLHGLSTHYISKRRKR